MPNFNIQEYSVQLKNDLELFRRWQVFVDALSTENNAVDLLDILDKVLDFDVHVSKMVRISKDYWFPTTHWVTVTFARLAELASLVSTDVILPKGQKSAELHFKEWPNAAFRFVKAPLSAGGYYLEEIAQELRVLYWDIEHKRFYLDTQQFSQLVQTQAIQLAGVEALGTFQKRLLAIADLLNDIDFDVVMPGLGVNQQDELIMSQKDLDESALDSLFVAAAKQQFILKRIQDGSKGVEITIGEIALCLQQKVLDDENYQWSYCIMDQNKQVTIFTLLQQLSFFYQWYKENINTAGLKDKREVFVD